MKTVKDQRRILWITARWPLPAKDGSSQASCAGIQQLTGSGELLDLLSFCDQTVTADQLQDACRTLGVKEIFLAPKRQRFKRFFRIMHAAYSLVFHKSLPFTYLPFRLNNFKDISDTENRSTWSHVIFDGPHTAVSFLRKGEQFFNSKVKFIYRAHNVEYSLWYQAAKKVFLPLRPLISGQSQKVKIFEQELLSRCSGLATVSLEDLNQFNLLYKLPITKVIPIGFDFDKPPLQVNTDTENHSDISLLFVGGISWGPNREGLIWFLENVWPAVSSLRKDISLVVAGRGTEKLKARFHELPNLKIMGEVEDLAPVYAGTQAAIVPVFYGSGTRVKAIEAGSYGLGCISTAIGVEGLPLLQGESYIRAENKEDWVSTLIKLNRVDLERIGKEAYRTLKATFDKKEVARAFVELLDLV